MKTLSSKSKVILDRAILHRDRCLSLALHFGEDSANAFHLKYKGDPGNDQARQEFERLILAAGN